MLQTSYSVNWSIASSMTSKLEPVIWLRDNGHIGIHEEADVRTYVLSRRDIARVRCKFVAFLSGFLLVF